METEHELKLEQTYFSRVASGQKTFEIRKNDRDFQVGDILILREFNSAEGWPDHGSYAVLRAKVVYLTDYMQQPGYVVMGIELLTDSEGK